MNIVKHKTLIVFCSIILLSIFACTHNKDFANMETKVTDEYAAIIWGNRTYVPYGVLSYYGKLGKQIGIVDGDKTHKVYECEGYSTDDWIVTALNHDGAMLCREINVRDVPNGWTSEYEWNKR